MNVWIWKYADLGKLLQRLVAAGVCFASVFSFPWTALSASVCCIMKYAPSLFCKRKGYSVSWDVCHSQAGWPSEDSGSIECPNCSFQEALQLHFHSKKEKKLLTFKFVKNNNIFHGKFRSANFICF